MSLNYENFRKVQNERLISFKMEMSMREEVFKLEQEIREQEFKNNNICLVCYSISKNTGWSHEGVCSEKCFDSASKCTYCNHTFFGCDLDIILCKGKKIRKSFMEKEYYNINNTEFFKYIRKDNIIKKK